MSTAVSGSISSLLARPAPKPGEWHVSYLLSVARRNGVKNPRPHHLQKLHALLGLPPCLRIPHVKGGAVARSNAFWLPQHGVVDLPAWAVPRSGGLSMKYCPHCLRGERVVRGRWWLRAARVCTLHGCFLRRSDETLRLDGGSEPSGPYASLLKLTELGDGSSADALDGDIRCSPNALAIQRRVWGPLEALVSEDAPSEGQPGMVETFAWTLLATHLLDLLVSLEHGSTAGWSDERHVSKTSEVVMGARLSISPSWGGVLLFLYALENFAHAFAIHACLRELVAQESAQPTVLSTLPIAELDRRLVVAFPELLIRNVAVRNVEPLSAQQSAKLELKHVSAEVRTASCRAWKRVRSTSSRDVPSTDVRLARRVLQSLVSQHEFAEKHGVENAMFRVLAERILPVVTAGPTRFVPREDVQALMARLELVARPPVSAESFKVPLFSMATVKALPRRLVYRNLLWAVLRGDLPVYRSLDRPGLSSFTCAPDCLEWAKRSAIGFWGWGNGSVIQRRNQALFERFLHGLRPGVKLGALTRRCRWP